MTQKEVVERLLNGHGLENKVISGGIYLSGWKFVNHNVNMSGMSITGDMALGGVVIRGDLRISRALINGQLFLDGAEIECDLILSETSVENKLDLNGASIGGDLYLYKTVIKGLIDLTFKNPPRRIFVFPEIAELIHWSAPNTPLIIMK